MLQEQKEVLKKLKDSSVGLDGIRRDIVKRIQEEERIQLIELKYVLSKITPDKIDAMFETAMERGNYPETLRLEYELAYGSVEKKSVLYKLMASDLSRVKSQVLKKLGMMTRTELIKEIEFSDQLLSAKGANWRVILVVVLSVAAAGLVSWALVSASKKRWERKQKEMERDYANRSNQADSQHPIDMENAVIDHENATQNIIDTWENNTANAHTNHENAMVEIQETFDLRAYLRDNGFVWMVCSVTQTQVSQFCTYNNTVYTGTKVCSKYCLKNPQTGQIAGTESSLICANATVPMNCNTPNAFDTGFSSGYSNGYDDGYETRYNSSYNDAYNAAYNSYYDSGHSDGYWDGRGDGYDDGYSDGYSAGLSDGNYDESQSYQQGYSAGYSDGYNYARAIFGG